MFRNRLGLPYAETVLVVFVDVGFDISKAIFDLYLIRVMFEMPPLIAAYKAFYKSGNLVSANEMLAEAKRQIDSFENVEIEGLHYVCQRWYLNVCHRHKTATGENKSVKEIFSEYIRDIKSLANGEIYDALCERVNKRTRDFELIYFSKMEDYIEKKLKFYPKNTRVIVMDGSDGYLQMDRLKNGMADFSCSAKTIHGDLFSALPELSVTMDSSSMSDFQHKSSLENVLDPLPYHDSSGFSWLMVSSWYLKQKFGLSGLVKLDVLYFKDDAKVVENLHRAMQVSKNCFPEDINYELVAYDGLEVREEQKYKFHSEICLYLNPISIAGLIKQALVGSGNVVNCLNLMNNRFCDVMRVSGYQLSFCTKKNFIRELSKTKLIVQVSKSEGDIEGMKVEQGSVPMRKSI